MLKASSPESFTSPKIISLKVAERIIWEYKKEGKCVGLCHGGFDLLHPGHIIHFESAKKLCDVLMVSVTSDHFVAGRKGSGRPVFTDQLRAYSIAALQCVDYVVITDVEKGVPILELLQPSYYIKGPDFIGKTTPGITAEREAIARVGGEMKYTTDVKLSTIEIIEYIKQELDRKEILVVLDRDGTLIEHSSDFFGQQDNWKEELQLKKPVASMVAYLQAKYAATNIVVTNQAGVARGYYSCQRVEEIHQVLHELLKKQSITISSWKYCPDVDSAYAKMMKNTISFIPKFVKEKTMRKPGVALVEEAIQELGLKMEDFNQVIVFGDRDEDKGLARNLKATFIDVKGKTFEEMKKEIS